MLFTESQLQTQVDSFALLDEAVYLTEQETMVRPQTVSIMENSRLHAYVLDFNGVRQLAESYGLDYLDAAVAVAESDGIDIANVCLAIDEADLIEDPELAELGAIVVRPLSELDEEFQFCLEAIDSYLDTEDDTYLDLITEIAFGDALGSEGVAKLKAAVGGNSSSKKATDVTTKLSGGAENQNAILQRIKGKAPKAASSIPLPQSASQATKLIQQIKAKAGDAAGATKKTVGGVVEKAKQAASSLTKGNSGNEGSGSKLAGLLGVGSSNSGSNGSNNSGGNGGNSGGGLAAIGGNSNSSSSSSSGMSLGKKAAIGVGVAAAIGGGILAYKQYRNKPKSVIAKRIAALRQTYSKFMNQAQKAPNDGIKNKLKKVAAKILSVIDKLMAFLQRKADS